MPAQSPDQTRGFTASFSNMNVGFGPPGGTPGQPGWTYQDWQNGGFYVHNGVEWQELSLVSTLTPTLIGYLPLHGGTGWTSSSTAGGGAAPDGPFSIKIFGPHLGAGFSQRVLDSVYLQRVDGSANAFNWNRRVVFSFRLIPYTSTISPEVRLKVIVGFAGNTGSGGLGGSCIGIQKFGHTNFSFLNNRGDGDTTIDTGINASYYTPIDFLIDSDGLGTSRLYINGDLAAVSDEAPYLPGSINRIQIAAFATTAVGTSSAMDFGVANFKFMSFD